MFVQNDLLLKPLEMNICCCAFHYADLQSALNQIQPAADCNGQR